MTWWVIGKTFPPDITIVRRNIGKNSVSAKRGYTVGICLFPVPGATHQITGLGLIARSRPLASGLIHAMSSPMVVTFQPLASSLLWRNKHGEVCLTAGRRKGCCKVVFIAPGGLNTKNKHVLGKPAKGHRLRLPAGPWTMQSRRAKHFYPKSAFPP